LRPSRENILFPIIHRAKNAKSAKLKILPLAPFAALRENILFPIIHRAKIAKYAKLRFLPWRPLRLCAKIFFPDISSRQERQDR
jgi:hypothetical protein